MEGWLNIDKEKGITSHDLVYKVRRALKMKRVGHAGTLDPMATGVMVVAAGKATRLIQFLQETKAYQAEVYLGITTNTLDAEGEKLTENPVEASESQVREIIKKYIGKIRQIPPMASAIHHNGVRLYELARQGIEVERKAREVEIYSIKLLEFSLPKFIIEVNCQSGTYIRTLADDIGRDIGCGAHLSALRRTRANDCFSVENSLQIENVGAVDLLPLDYPLAHLQKAILNDQDAVRYGHGQHINIKGFQEGFLRVYNQNEQLLGIAEFSGNKIIPKVNLN